MNRPSIKILLVEDKEEDYLIVRDLLATIEWQQFELEWKSTYEDGLQAIQTQHYDVSLVDYRLAAHTGVEFLQDVRKRGCQAPIILLTGETGLAVDAEAISASAADFLDKNELTAALLERTIRHAIEQTRTMEALRRSEERYRAFIANSSEAIWCCELAHPVSTALPEDQQIEQFYQHAYLCECNETTARLHGLADPQELVGARLGDLLVRSDPANIHYLRSFIRSAYRLSDVESCEVDHGGQTKYFLNNLSATIEDGAVRRMWATQRDVTEPREAEVMRSRLAAIVEFSHDAIISNALDGTILSWNQSAEKLYGYSEDEVKGKNIALLIPPEHSHDLQEILETIRHGGHIQQFETVRVRKDGSRVDVALTVSPIKNTMGQIVGVSKIARDVTERKRAEEEMQAVLTNARCVLWRARVQAREGWEQDAENRQYTLDWQLHLYDENIARRVLPLEFSEEQEYLQSWAESRLAEDRWRMNRTSHQALLSGQPHYSQDFRCVDRFGKVHWLQEGVTVHRRDEGGWELYGVWIDITPHKQVEEALRASEERFRIAAQTSSDLIYEWNILTDGLKWFGDIDAILGYAPGEFPHTFAAWEAVLHPDDRERIMVAIARSLEGNEPFQEEYRIQHKDGTYLYWTDKGIVICDENGHPGRWIGAISDVSERKRAEQARIQLTLELQEQRQRLSDILATVPGVVWEAYGAPNAADQRLDYVSDYVTTMLGYSVDEWLATPHFWLKIVHPEDKDRAAQQAAAKFSSGQKEARANQFRWITKEGRTLWVESQSLAIHNERDEPIGIRGVTMDITTRKQAEEELDRFFTLSLEMLCIAGNDGYFKRFNPAWERALGYSKEELLSRPYLDFVHPEDYAATIMAAQRLTAGKDVVAFENRFRCSDGSYRWLMWHSAAVPEQGLVYAVAHDFTERKRAEASLKTYAEQLERSNRELQDFAYVASHDLQEPLRKIQAFSDRLSSEYSEVLSDNGSDYLRRMQNAAGRMQGLIKDLLSFSRITTQAQPSELVDLNQIVGEVVSDLETQIKESGAHVEIDRLPVIEADPTQMRQLLQNLLSNALKFQRRDETAVGDEPAPQVHIRSQKTRVQENLRGEKPAIEELCHIIVQDNGIGFDEKHIERIFTPFQRLHGRNQYEGTGMGLAICRKIVERHNGHITASSSPGHGASFIVTLPVKPLDS